MAEGSGRAPPGTPFDRTIAALLVLVTTLSLYLQVVAVTRTEVVHPIRADARDYVVYALNLREHGVYSRTAVAGAPPPPDAVRPPGYPLFLLGLLGARSSEADFVGRVTGAQAILGAALTPLAFALGWLALRSRALALGTAALTALTPQLVTASTYLLTETLFATCVAAGCVALLAGVRRPTRRVAWWCAAGVLLGLSALVRPTTLYLPIALAAALFIWFREPGSRRAAAVLLLAFGAVVAPWFARNSVAIGRFADSTLMLGSIHHGAYPGFTYRDDPATYGYPYRADPRSAEATRDLRALLRFVATEIADRPGRMAAWYLVEKPFYLVAWEPIQGAGDVFLYPVERSPFLGRAEFRAVRKVMHAAHWPLMLAAYAGLVFVLVPSIRRVDEQRRALALVAIVFAYVVAIHVVAAPFPRYSVPFRPLQYVLALAAIASAWRWVRNRRGGAS